MTYDITIKTNLQNVETHLRAFQRLAPAMMSEVIHEFGDATFDLSQEYVPRRTNNLARSGYVDNTSPLYSRVGYTAPYAIYVERGVLPHVRMVERNVMVKGKLVSGYMFFHHSGQRPQPYLSRAVKEVLERASEIAGAVFDRIAERILGQNPRAMEQ